MFGVKMIEHNGKMYARVSDILKPFTGYDNWSEEMLAKRDKKAILGTGVHKAISDDIEGHFPIPPNGGNGYYKSFCKWREQIKPIFIQNEKRYFCDKLMITGQIDSLIGLSHNTINPNTIQLLPILIDYKTSVAENKVTCPMQAHLYNYLLAENGIIVSPRYLFLKLDRNGNDPQLFEYRWNANTNAKCLNAVDKFWDKNK